MHYGISHYSLVTSHCADFVAPPSELNSTDRCSNKHVIPNITLITARPLVSVRYFDQSVIT